MWPGDHEREGEQREQPEASLSTLLASATVWRLGVTSRKTGHAAVCSRWPRAVLCSNTEHESFVCVVHSHSVNPDGARDSLGRTSSRS